MYSYIFIIDARKYLLYKKLIFKFRLIEYCVINNTVW